MDKAFVAGLVGGVGGGFCFLRGVLAYEGEGGRGYEGDLPSGRNRCPPLSLQVWGTLAPCQQHYSACTALAGPF